MNKNTKIILLMFCILAITITNLEIKNTKAQDPKEIIQKNIGINPENIPQNQDELKEEIKKRYLEKEWSNIISNITIIGPMHNFLLKSKNIFIVPFGEPYSFTPTFILIAVLWLYFFLLMYDIIKGSKIVQKTPAFLISLGAAVIIAQTGLIKNLVTGALTLIYSKEAWWLRIIILILLFGGLYLVYFIEKKIGRTIRKEKEKQKIGEIKKETEESKSFIKGVKEAQNITKKYKIT